MRESIQFAGKLRDRDSFLHYYERFGSRHLDPMALDSQAAVETGEQIERELAVAPVRARRD